MQKSAGGKLLLGVQVGAVWNLSLVGLVGGHYIGI